MKKKKILIISVIALAFAMNISNLLADIPPVVITCDKVQAGRGQCFEPVPDFPGECRWTGYTDDYC
jgi:hypothetical protein